MRPMEDVLKRVQSLGLDQLDAFRDITKLLQGFEVKRHGKQPLTLLLAMNPDLRECLKLAQRLSMHDLRHLEIVVDGLYKANDAKTHIRGGGINTKKGRNTGYGWLEWKSFTRIRLVVDPVTKNPGFEEVVVGPYLYWRMIASRGDKNKKRRIMRSVYLGKSVAHALESEFITEEDIKKAALSGTIEQLKERCKEEYPPEDL
jgi:hypothetical protein